jgi:uncharacterized protein
MKLIKIAIFLSLTICSNAFAQTFPNKPEQGNFIIDEARMVDENNKKSINQISQNLLSQKHIPIIVVTINSLADYGADSLGIEKYATDLFNSWGIGSEGINYGMLLLISKNDRKARLEFGKSFDHRYDAEAGKIMDGLIIPKFKQGDFNGGILVGVQALDALARDLKLPQSEASKWFILIAILLIILVVGIAYSLFKSGRTGWGWAFLGIIGAILLMILFRGGSGQGGFGGGSGGGGGATGSW